MVNGFSKGFCATGAQVAHKWKEIRHRTARMCFELLQ